MYAPFVLVHPELLLLALALGPILLFRGLRQNTVGHSFVALTRGMRSSHWTARLSQALLIVAWLAACVAAAQPQYADATQSIIRESRDLAVTVDVSNSMVGIIPGGGMNAQGKPYRRIDAARDAVCDFISGREGDRIALMTFSDESYYLWPLTSDIELLQKKCSRLADKLLGGTNFQGPVDGAGAKGALQAPLDHLLEMSQSSSRVVIIVTDGEANINDVRFSELAAEYEENRITLYVIGVGEEWTTGAANERTEPLRRFVERVNGKVYAADDEAGFARAMQDIDAMETSKVVEKTTTQQDIYRFFLLASVVAWLGYLSTISATRETF